jgi:hypothetical protein
MMPVSPEVMRVRCEEEELRRRPVNPDQRDRPLRRRGRQPDPLGMRMSRMPVAELVEDVDQRIDRGRGRLRDAIAFFRRRIPAKPLSTATGER